MTDPKTRWDKIQAWFKNNPIGVIILLLLAIVGAIATSVRLSDVNRRQTVARGYLTAFAETVIRQN